MNRLAEKRLDDLFRRDPRECIRGVRDRFSRRLESADRGLLLYGAGHYGRVALDSLQRKGIRPAAFVDADPAKCGTEIGGVPVIGLHDLDASSPKEVLVVVTVYNCVSVLEDLGARGFDTATYAQAALALGEPLTPYCGIRDPALLWECESEIRAALGMWSDDASRDEFISQLEWSMSLDPFALAPPHAASETYYDRGIVRFGPNEVYVDCGAFDGDSAAAFIARCPDYRRIVALEPDPGNRTRFAHRFGGESRMQADRITLLPYAASDRRSVLSFNATGTAGSAFAQHGITLDAATLDELVGHEHPTFIKMDIEGAEPLALAGARQLIAAVHPTLAVCLYHDRSHLWQLPRLMAEMQPGYNLFLRRYADECWELVCYASMAS
jgi:FkbM family methyltransferase